MTTVIKKDGRKTPFYIEKIESNLDSAERVFGVKFKTEKDRIIDEIDNRVSAYDEIESYRIFDIVEDVLKDEPWVLLAFKEFKRREQVVIDESTDLDYQLKRYHAKDKDIMNENGNKDSRTVMTQRELLAGVVSKTKGLEMYPEDVRRAHLKGLIHLHDLDRSPYQGIPNCSLPDFEFMLKNGVQLGNAKVESPKSISTAVSILGILVAAISSEQYGLSK